jgi:serine phosphatase RsbU (regulator of sigma subunit)
MMVLLRRMVLDRQEKQRLAGELEAASVVQRLMLASHDEHSAGLSIEAVYRPALEVGGDFYYVMSDGDVRVLVTGDVSGKGLRAAMLVALLIGALRETRSRGAGAVLEALNRVVSGQTDGGFVTAAVARLEGGCATIASAGNPAPYLNGVEVELMAGPPLGIDPSAEYRECEIHLGGGRRLTFVSDGVLEAANARRELFGFERTREISTKSAQEIVEVARAWGQNDDITVVTVRRSP